MTKRNPAWPGPTPCVYLLACLLVVGGGLAVGPPDATAQRAGDVIHQVGTLHSLLEGKFEGTATVGDLVGRGTLGLGTVDRVDGEMIVVDGTAYAIRDDGTVDELDSATALPFGVVVPFEVDTTLTLTDVPSFAELHARLDERLSSIELYAFRAVGTFDSLRTRSVSAQQPPYPSLEEVVANETHFTFDDVEGTMVGFRIPAVFEGVNAVGHHAHFLTAGRDGGGHVLDVGASELTVEIDRASSLRVAPRTP